MKIEERKISCLEGGFGGSRREENGNNKDDGREETTDTSFFATEVCLGEVGALRKRK